MCPCQQGHSPRGGRRGLVIKTATRNSCLHEEGAELGRRMCAGGLSPWLCLGTVSPAKWTGCSETHCSTFSQAVATQTHNFLLNLNHLTVLEKRLMAHCLFLSLNDSTVLTVTRSYMGTEGEDRALKDRKPQKH